MAQINFHLQHLPPEEQPRAEAELRWMVQNARPRGALWPWIRSLFIGALGFGAGVFWERGEQMIVYQSAAAFLALLVLWWLVATIRRRSRFKSEWEMVVLRWHAARGRIRDAVHQGHPKEAMSHAKEESKSRDELMDLLRG